MMSEEGAKIIAYGIARTLINDATAEDVWAARYEKAFIEDGHYSEEDAALIRDAVIGVELELKDLSEGKAKIVPSC